MMKDKEKERIYSLLKDFPCSTSKQLACFYHRAYNETIKPASISGKLRVDVLKGKVAESLDAYGKKVYWLV
jgi:hypothetical protein